ncbi:hypothetical protein CA11_59300 [Gimesia maris]|uniref:hypothetical protein n=1 Tax=Gimesia maris TaxID=122 RepID=UPI00118CE65F|nr:hypothetical protein [Gimesia maris]QDU18079.1 hypothetical protein CA11_59300 [Gimesia maris]
MKTMQLNLTEDEALVLFELLSRFSEDSILGIEDQAEQRVLWNLQAILEQALPESFQQNYQRELAATRDRLRDEPGLTNANQEQQKGRLALWLEPDQIRFLANEWRKIPKEAPEVVQKQWGEVAFRSMAALHKAGLHYDPEFPQSGEAYQVKK